MKITAHTLIKNEERWIWFALHSVLDHVDEIMVWDTGSTDRTVSLVKSIPSPKIKLRQIQVSTPQEHTDARAAMLKNTSADWILILDGDEIWWSDSLRACRKAIDEHPDLSALISPFINVVGDVFHYQSNSGSHYQIGSRRGAYNLRFINGRIPGLHISNPHGRQEYRNAKDISLQHFPQDQLLFVDAPYLHTTHLQRSATRSLDTSTLKRDFKYRIEYGHAFPVGFTYPEPFYLPRIVRDVPDPFIKRSWYFSVQSLAYSPARTIKKMFTGTPSGY